MNGMPIIKLEVEEMRHAIKVALSKYTAELDACVQEAVDKYCEPENIRYVVHQAATQAIDACVKEGIKGFFGYWGRAASTSWKRSNVGSQKRWSPQRRHWR